MAVPLLASSGCATLLKGDQSTIPVTSEPVCASVYVDGLPSGRTPVTLKLPSKNRYVVQVERDGYRSAAAPIDPTLGGGWVVLDILFLGFPAIVDAGTGAWNYSVPDGLHVVLDRGESPPSGHAPQAESVEDCLKSPEKTTRAAQEAARLQGEALARCLQAAESLPSPQRVAWAKADCRSPRPPAPPDLSPSKGRGQQCTWSAECSSGLACPWGSCIPWEVTPASK